MKDCRNFFKSQTNMPQKTVKVMYYVLSYVKWNGIQYLGLHIHIHIHTYQSYIITDLQNKAVEIIGGESPRDSATLITLILKSLNCKNYLNLKLANLCIFISPQKNSANVSNWFQLQHNISKRNILSLKTPNLLRIPRCKISRLQRSIKLFKLKEPYTSIISLVNLSMSWMTKLFFKQKIN